jgi:hypothetical protein
MAGVQIESISVFRELVFEIILRHNRNNNTSFFIRKTMDFFKLQFPFGTSIHYGANLQVILGGFFRSLLSVFFLSAHG